MNLNKKRQILLDNTFADAKEFLANRAPHLTKEDISNELRWFGQYDIIEKKAGYPESLKLMWYWREMADELLEGIEEDEQNQ